MRSNSSGMVASAPSRGGHRRLELAEEHRAVHDEVVVVQAIAGIDVQRPLRARYLRSATIASWFQGRRRDSCRRARRYASACGCRWPGVRHQGRAASRRPQRLFRPRRHFHQMDIQMQDAGMAHARPGHVAAPVPEPPALRRCGIRRPARRISGPTSSTACGSSAPRRRRRARRRSSRNWRGRRPHGVGEGVVPGHVGDRLGLRIASGQRLDQRLLRRRRRHSSNASASCAAAWPLASAPCAAGVVEQHPTACCSWARRRRRRPNGPWRSPGRLRAPLETGNGLLVVIAVGPDQATVEPCLRFRRFCRDRKMVSAEIVAVVHGYLPRLPCQS